jgi:hypothetical protein
MGWCRVIDFEFWILDFGFWIFDGLLLCRSVVRFYGTTELLKH